MGNLWYTLDENEQPVAVGRYPKFEAATEVWSPIQEVVNGFRVSTVFLALDHSHGEGESPLLWETMVFDWRHEERFLAIYCDRYSSADDARKGHLKAVEWVKSGAAVKAAEDSAA